VLPLFRRILRRLPAAARPPLGPDERVVAWAGTDGDGVVVATNLGLWLPAHGARFGWHEIHKATWSGRALLVVPAEEVRDLGEYVEMADREPVGVTLVDPGRLPEQVRARVTRSVAYTSHHPLPGGGVRVVARRVPGRDGVRWAVRYDPGTPRSEPVAARVAGLVAQGRAAISGSETVGPPR
jgi:hypothetical protein